MSAQPLRVDGLTAGYGATRILEDVSFDVAAGKRVAILGRNGAGKTTLLATIAGQTKRDSGKIQLGTTEISTMESPARAHSGLGYVPQLRCIFSSLTVAENLLVGLKGRPAEAVEEAYIMFPRLKERHRNLGSQLSGGEQQMLSTARTILGRPSVLLLDEPLEGLAPVICEELMQAFSNLAETGQMTILLVEQRIKSALDFAQHAFIMERGRIAWGGAPAELESQPELVESLLGIAVHR